MLINKIIIWWVTEQAMISAYHKWRNLIIIETKGLDPNAAYETVVRSLSTFLL